MKYFLLKIVKLGMNRNLVLLTFLLSMCFFVVAVKALPITTQKIAANNISTTTAPSNVWECKTTADCTFHGHCDADKKFCICDSGYVNYNCSYKQKKQLSAFLLHTIFLGLIGAGEFYVENYYLGAIQAGLFVFGVPAVSFFAKSKKETWYEMSSGIIGVLMLLGSASSWIADMFDFGRNEIYDGNGQPLDPW